MTRRALVRGLILGIVVVDLLPLWLLGKQALTSEAESFAWPPSWYPHALTLEDFRAVHAAIELGRGLGLSLLVGALTTLLALALALPAAWSAARQRAIHRRMDALMVVARLFPSIAVAVPLATIFVRLGLYNHPAGVGLWLAHTLLALPFAYLILQAALRDVPSDLEEAALLDGATPFGAFVRVVVPVIRPALGAAAIMVFLVSWDEFGYALLLQVTNRPLPPLLYYFVVFGHPGLASAVAAIMVIPALAVIVLLESALRSGALAGSGR